MILVSACLLGVPCRYSGRDSRNEKIVELYGRDAIPVCPEQLGGLPTPRQPAGIFGGFGGDVLDGKATVRSVGDGEDLTANFVRGAEEVLKLAGTLGIKSAILKQASPSCGCGVTWQLDGKMENHKVEGDGVAAALLKRNGISVVSDKDLGG
jgi:uncharacterized protein YbbK (DUF523 family)